MSVDEFGWSNAQGFGHSVDIPIRNYRANGFTAVGTREAINRLESLLVQLLHNIVELSGLALL